MAYHEHVPVFNQINEHTIHKYTKTHTQTHARFIYGYSYTLYIPFLISSSFSPIHFPVDGNIGELQTLCNRPCHIHTYSYAMRHIFVKKNLLRFFLRYQFKMISINSMNFWGAGKHENQFHFS